MDFATMSYIYRVIYIGGFVEFQKIYIFVQINDQIRVGLFTLRAF